MSKTVLLHTLGNRDLQFPKDKGIPSGFARAYLMDNTEIGAENYLVIKKSGGFEEQRSFRDISALILKACQDDKEGLIYRQALSFPMLDQAIQYVFQHHGGLDKLLLCTTHQLPSHAQDTDLVAEIATQHFQEKFKDNPKVGEILIRYLNISPTNKGRERMLQQFHQLFQELKEEGFENIYISNNQGLPAATKALDFIGLFQGYHYLSIHPLEGVNEVSNIAYEEILTELIRERLIEIIKQTPLAISP